MHACLLATVLCCEMQGYLVRNEVINVEFDVNSFVPFAHGMGLIPNDLYKVVALENDISCFTTFVFIALYFH